MLIGEAGDISLRDVVSRHISDPDEHLEGSSAAGQAFNVVVKKSLDTYTVNLFTAIPRRWYREEIRVHLIDSSNKGREEYSDAVDAHLTRMIEEKRILRNPYTSNISEKVTLYEILDWDENSLSREYLQRGDIIAKTVELKVADLLDFLHAGVYLGQGQVAHFAGTTPSDTKLKIDTLQDFAFRGEQKERLRIVEFNDTHNTAEDTARAAEHHLREAAAAAARNLPYPEMGPPWHPFSNNCQHFVALCALGRKEMFQEKKALRWALIGAGGSLAASSAVTSSAATSCSIQ